MTPPVPPPGAPDAHLLAVLAGAHAEFIEGADPRALFGALLERLLALSRSEYGFVAEVQRDAAGAPFLKTHALTDIAWDDATRELYRVHQAQGLEFRNLKTLFGAALVTGAPVIANDVEHDPRSGGRPIGHPVMRAFLGVPLHRGGDLVGMVGLANRAGGYDEALLAYLAPFLETCTSLLYGYRIDRQRRAAEGELRAANARLSALLSTTEAGVLLESEDRRIVLTNRRFCSLFGIAAPPEALAGTDCSTAAEASRALFADPVGFVARVAEVLARGEPVHAEALRMADGRVLERDYVPIRVEGVDRGHYWQYRDVTARERAAEALRRREEEAARLAMVASRTSNGVVITDAAGVCEWVNEGFTRMTGWTSAEIVGQRPGARLQGPATDPATVERMRRAVRGGKAFVVDVLNYAKDGRRYWVRVDAQPVFDGAGTLRNYIAIETDVTERVEQERREARLASLQWVVREVVTAFLHEGETAPVADRMLRRVGAALDASRATIVERRADGAFVRSHLWVAPGARPPSPESALPAAWRDELERGRVVADAVGPDELAVAGAEGRAPDGPGSRLALPVLSRGALEAVVGFEDASPRRAWRPEEVAVLQALVEGYARAREREESAARLRDAVDRAESASRAKSEFLASMSHEIRTPMTAIVGYAELLARPDVAPEQQEAWRGHLRRNAHYLLSLVDDILDLSRIEAGQVVPKLEDVDPAAVLPELSALFGPRAAERMLDLDVRAVGRLPRRVTTDPTRLQQVLVNLVGNALKFTDRGGVDVTLAAEVAGDGHAWLRYEVADTGIGIPPEKLGMLFTPFGQVHGAEERRRGGTGLGLAISRRFARLLGGDVDVRSTEGVGSVFTLRLDVGPVAADGWVDAPATLPAARTAPTVAGRPTLRGRRILVVDDAPDNRRILRFLLEERGATVAVAEDGAMGVEAVAEAARGGAPFELVVLDMQMPVMDGYEAVRTLRARGDRVPVLALTAYAMAGDAAKCIEAGCDRYLSKPIVPKDFAAVVDALLGAAAREPGLDGPPPAPPTAAAAARPSPAAPPPAAPAPAPAAGGSSAASLASDPSFAPYIAEYVAGMPAVAETLAAARAGGDAATMQRIAHRVRGTAASYGFPAVSEAAGRCEDALRAGDLAAAGPAVDALVAALRARA